MELNFRQATLDDVESTFAIKRAAFRPYVELVFGWDEDDQWQRHKAEFSCETVRLILRDGKDVGYVLVRRLADPAREFAPALHVPDWLAEQGFPQDW